MSDLNQEEINQSEEHMNPLMEEAVNEKSYARPNIKINAQEAAVPIPEPTIVPPPSTPKEEPEKGAPKPPPPPVNPKMNELNPKEKTNAAKTAAAMAMNAYEAVHMFGNHVVKINEGKIQSLTEDGLVDLRIGVPISEDENVTIGEYIEEYNNQTGDVFIVTKEFKEEVTPVLERVLEKKGIGATDEQMLMYFFAKDLVVKGAQFIALMRERKRFINKLVNATEAFKQGMAGRTQQHAPQYTAPQPQPQSPQPEATYQQPAYTPPPVPPSMEDDGIEIAEIIPNETVFDVDSEINEPEHVDRVEIHEKPKRAYTKKSDTKKTTRKRNKLND